MRNGLHSRQSGCSKSWRSPRRVFAIVLRSAGGYVETENDLAMPYGAARRGGNAHCRRAWVTATRCALGCTPDVQSMWLWKILCSPADRKLLRCITGEWGGFPAGQRGARPLERQPAVLPPGSSFLPFKVAGPRITARINGTGRRPFILLSG